MRRLLLSGKAAWVLSILILGFGSACTQPRDNPAPQHEHGNTATVSFAISTGDVHVPPDATGSASPGHVSALAFSYASITRIRIDVTDTASNSTVYVNFDLEKDGTGTWKGTLPFLPRNTPLRFHAEAHGTGTDPLFEGTTVQTLLADAQPVVIVLVAANDGQPISLPRLLRIAVPSVLGSEQSGNVSFSVAGNPG